MHYAKKLILENQVIQFLTCLNNQISIVQTQVMPMEPLPSFNRVYSLVLLYNRREKL